MHKSIIAAAFAATVAVIPTAAFAAPTVLTVDLERILNECTACRAASATIQSQVQQARTRAQTLEGQLKPEATALQTAAEALGGKPADAALRKRASDFQARQQAAQTELANKQSSIESTQSNVQQQIGARVVQIAEQIRARRQADLVMAKNSTLASNPAGDVTGEVLAALNQQLPSVSVTPLPQQNRPAGR
ncbi:MAG: OmpH family outer membrane protein [Sphingomicrobium sp.]